MGVPSKSFLSTIYRVIQKPDFPSSDLNNKLKDLLRVHVVLLSKFYMYPSVLFSD